MAEKGGKSVKNPSGVEFVKWFSELSNKDIPIAGGKGASLAEMYNNKFPVPPGFMITAQAYAYFIEKSGLAPKIKEMIETTDMEDTEKLEKISDDVRALIVEAEMPIEMGEAIKEAYDILDVDKNKLSGAIGTALTILKHSYEPPFVAVRSSATMEDLADASFAGQQESFVNVKGKVELIQKVKECFASLFTARAIYYRANKGFAQDKAYLAVVIQRMINSDKSGVIFSKNPITGDSTIMLEAVWGLGEGIVSGRVKPDNYIVDGNLDEFNIASTSISEKKTAITRSSSGENQIVKLTGERSKQQVLTTYEIKRLAQYARQLEEHYGKPQDIEFAIEGKDIYIVQSRPITTLGMEKKEKREISGEVLLSGLGASPGIGSGPVKIVHTLDDLKKIKKGDILVTEMTNPDMVVTMQRASGIVTNEGGITSHAAIVSREMGIPAVVGTGDATTKLKDEQIITVDGNSGRVFEGKGETKLAEVNRIVPTKTKIKVIVDLPDFAERAALSGAKAVGLTRIEGIIAGSGKHPLMFSKQGKMEDYVELLYQGLKKIANPFEEVWVRTSDIRSDEFRHLEGSPREIEGNPMLGNHGVRFSLQHPEIMKAEISAIKKVAEEFPTKRLGIMMPQVISVEEVRGTKKIASEVDLPINVRMGVMIETPAAVQIINELCAEGISFISFGTNDLTQYILAIDRNNSEVQYIYDEMNPAVLSALSYVIRRCKKYHVETSVCGQSGSREDMARFLVSQGIDSISVNADAAEKISKFVAGLESGEIPLEPEKEKPAAAEVIEPAAVAEKLDIFDGKSEEKAAEENVEEAKNEEPVESQKAEGDVPTPTPETGANAESILSEVSEIGDEYMPGGSRKNTDIPPLNDAILVESELFEGKSNIEEFDLSKELKIE